MRSTTQASIWPVASGGGLPIPHSAVYAFIQVSSSRTSAALYSGETVAESQFQTYCKVPIARLPSGERQMTKSTFQFAFAQSNSAAQTGAVAMNAMRPTTALDLRAILSSIILSGRVEYPNAGAS
jgi:hypothetical protein